MSNRNYSSRSRPSKVNQSIQNSNPVSNKPKWRGKSVYVVPPVIPIPEALPMEKPVFVLSSDPNDYIVYAHRAPKEVSPVINESFDQKSAVQIPNPNITSALAENQVKPPEINPFNDIADDVLKDDLHKSSIFGKLLAGAVIVGLFYKLRKSKA